MRTIEVKKLGALNERGEVVYGSEVLIVVKEKVSLIEHYVVLTHSEAADLYNKLARIPEVREDKGFPS